MGKGSKLKKMKRRENHRLMKHLGATNGLTITALAAKVGVGKSHVSLVMRGLRTPSVDVLTRMAAVLNESVDSLNRRLAGLRKDKAAA